MTMPRRAATLAVCLLAMAAGASAAACTATGTLQLDLTSSTVANDPLAKCLSSMQVTYATVDGDCRVTVTPLAASGNYVPALWASSVADAATYTELSECPYTATSVTKTVEGTALLAALRTAIYGVEVDAATVTTATFGTGTATLARTGASAATLEYAITSSSVSNKAAIACSEDTAPCKASTSTKCSNGAYGINLAAGGKVCALCPAGTYSDDGIGCTSCPSGSAAASVGAAAAATCTRCAAGTYAQGGNSDCLPCGAGTYQDVQPTVGVDGSCKPCPDSSWAWYPGSTACLQCVNGIPVAYSADNTPSSGYHKLSLKSDAAGAALKGSCSAVSKPALVGQCGMTRAATQLSVFVDYDCSVEIAPITDPACAEPGASGYNYEDLKIQGFYASTNAIRTMLPANASGYSSSFLLSLTPSTLDGELDLKIFGATTDPASAGAVTAGPVCTGIVSVSGGKVADEPSSPAACGAGSFSQAGCSPCPTGAYCSGGTKTTCAADTSNKLVGAATGAGDCVACDHSGGSPMTSEAGADYCTIPWFDVSCGDGTEYDDSSRSCVPCATGTKRASGESSCTACAAGTFASSTTACSACAGNSVAPVAGMGACTACPVGSVASSNKQSCSACPPGQYALANGDGTFTCTACKSGYYRSGDATPENNVCKPIPAGYREKTSSDAAGTVAQSEIVPCELGTFSAWDSDPTNPAGTAARTPSGATVCQACATNFYAPRRGMQRCLACKAGTAPTKSVGSLLGPDQCTSCATAVGANTFRAAFTASNTCAFCTPGSETAPSNYAACTQCRPGSVMAADAGNPTRAASDTCSECPRHYFQSRAGQAACLSCPAGAETDGTGNTECSPCARGYYNPAQNSACVTAPAGTFVNTTGATTFTSCAVGYFSDEPAAEACDACAPGQYANTVGSKACKTCPAGTSSAGAASTCVSCRAGFFATAGSSVCSPCRPGTFAKDPRSGTCSPCPAGRQCPLIATAAPAVCGKGYFSRKEGARLCSACPVNSFQDGTSPTQCRPCPAGTNTRGRTGQSACQAVRTRTLRMSMF